MRVQEGASQEDEGPSNTWFEKEFLSFSCQEFVCVWRADETFHPGCTHSLGRISNWRHRLPEARLGGDSRGRCSFATGVVVDEDGGACFRAPTCTGNAQSDC